MQIHPNKEYLHPNNIYIYIYIYIYKYICEPTYVDVDANIGVHIDTYICIQLSVLPAAFKQLKRDVHKRQEVYIHTFDEVQLPGDMHAL